MKKAAPGLTAQFEHVDGGVEQNWEALQPDVQTGKTHTVSETFVQGCAVNFPRSVQLVHCEQFVGDPSEREVPTTHGAA